MCGKVLRLNLCQKNYAWALKTILSAVTMKLRESASLSGILNEMTLLHFPGN